LFESDDISKFEVGSANGLVQIHTYLFQGLFDFSGDLHGDLEQRDRDKVMRKFKSHTLQMLVATDISARGIDVDDLAYVVHYQLPDQLEYYTHRSGRTARAGKRGISLAFVNAKEVRRIRMIETQLGISFRKL
jgi:ATP-dependent RNA helicase DeaD